MTEQRKEKKIEIFYMPHMNVENDVLQSTGRVGYYIHSNEDGVIGYRLFMDSLTTLVPTGNVWKIELDL